MHYLINVDGKYIEIQMRTLLDEAWGECTHDIVYKGVSTAQLTELQYLSQCLAQQTIAAEGITNLIYEKVNKKGTIFGGTKKAENRSKISSSQYEKRNDTSRVESRMKLLEEKVDDEFDGNVDLLI